MAGGLNLYGFAAGDPVNLSDPLGLDPCEASSAWTECLAQALADWGAHHGGTAGKLAVNAGAGLNAAMEATGINGAASTGDAIANGRLVEGGVGLAMIVPLGRPARFLSRGAGAVAAKEAGQLAETLGFSRRAKNVPFNSHGQAVFTDGKNFITIDVDSHNGGVWKMFDRRGDRLGTYDALLSKIK